MNDRHQIVDHLTLRGKPFLIQNEHFASVTLTEVFKPGKSEAGQTVFMSQNQYLDLTIRDSIYHSKKLLALKVQAT